MRATPNPSLRLPTETPVVNIRNVSSKSIALMVTGLFIAGVGTYTHNTGFQFAGALIFSVGIGIAIDQARKPSKRP